MYITPLFTAGKISISACDETGDGRAEKGGRTMILSEYFPKLSIISAGTHTPQTAVFISDSLSEKEKQGSSPQKAKPHAIPSIQARLILPERRHLEQTQTVLGVPSTTAFTLRILGFHVLFVLRFEWDTLCPKTTPFPQILHFAIPDTSSKHFL